MSEAERIVQQRIRKNTVVSVSANKRKPKLKLVYTLCVSKHKMTYAKGFTPNWTKEIFTTHDVRTSTVSVIYPLKDDTELVLKDDFYE